MTDLNVLLVSETPVDIATISNTEEYEVVDLNKRRNMDILKILQKSLIPLEDLPETDDDILYSRIEQLEILLDDVEVIETRGLIEFHILLLKQFLSSNVDRILPLIDYTNTPALDVAAQSHFTRQKSTLSLADSTISHLNIPIPSLANEVLSWMSLKSLAMQVFTKYQPTMGLPTVSQISHHILIGTSLSALLVFDLNQKCVAIFQPSLPNFGAVTSISSSYSHKLIVSGYDSGHICLWDTTKKILLKTINPLESSFKRTVTDDGHIQNHKITHLSFVGPKERFVSADDHGTAFYHTFNRFVVMNTLTSTRIHCHPSDKNVPTTIFAISGLPHVSVPYPGEDLRLVAISTPYKVSIMSMKPFPQIIFRIYWESEDPLLKIVPISCLSWLCAKKQRSSIGVEHVSNPKLAVSFGSHVIIFKIQWDHDNKKLSLDDSNTIKISKESQFFVDGPVVSLQWLNRESLACLTKKEDLIFYHVPTSRVLEQVDLRKRQIISHDYYSESLNSVIECEWAYHYSVSIFKGRLFWLGSHDIMIASPISWNERISILVETNQFKEAFEMALSLYQGTPQHLVVGLPFVESIKSSALEDCITHMISKYLDYKFPVNESDSQDLNQNEFSVDIETIVSILCTCCVIIDRPDILFNEIFERLSQNNQDEIFIKTIEPLILDGRIKTLVSPVIMQNILSYFESKGWLDRLEMIILKLDVINLDIHTTLELCRKHLLLSALIYIYNHALGDFITPIVEILKLMTLESEQKSERFYVLYMYISYTLTRKSFPFGKIFPERMGRQIQINGYSLLFSQKHLLWQSEPIIIGQEPFPYLSYIMETDPTEFVKLFGTLMDDSSLNDATTMQIELPKSEENKTGVFINRQFIMNTLLTLEKRPMNSCDKITIKSFVCRMYAKYRRYFTLDSSVLQDLMREIVLSTDSDSHRERQLALLSLLESGVAFESELNLESNMQMYENAKFWRVYELIARKADRVDLVVKSYLNDEERWLLTVGAIREIFYDPSLSYQNIFILKNFIFENLEEIVQIQNGLVANLFNDLWPSEHENAMDKLIDKPNLQLIYLKNLFGNCESTGSGISILRKELLIELYDRFFYLLCIFEPNSLKCNLIKSCEVSETYPFSVLKMLGLCKEYHVLDAAIWILESSGNFKECMQLVMYEISLSEIYENLKGIVNEGISFLERSTTKLSANEQQRYWFQLFDTITNSSNEHVSDSEIKSILNQILEAMISHISLPAILLHIVKVQKHASLGEYRKMIESMLSLNFYEKELYACTNEMISNEVYEKFSYLVKSKQKALKPDLGYCKLCHLLIHKREITHGAESGELVLLDCSHMYHGECFIKLRERCIECGNEDEVKLKKGKSKE